MRRRAIVTVDRRSFPIESAKVVPIGHGIDLAEFPCADRSDGAGDFRLAVLGRYSRAKGLETILRGVGLAIERGVDVRLEVFGPALNAAEREHRGELERLVAELGLDKRVRLDPAVRRSEVPDVLARARALVNNMVAGAPDKVVYEAAASCLPVLVSNPVFDDFTAGLEASADVRARRPGRPRRPDRASWPRSRPTCAPSSGARCTTASRRATRSSTGPTASSRSHADDLATQCCKERQGRSRPARAEGGRHLRVRGAPALAPASTPRARLGHAALDAARERARRLGLRARAHGPRRAARRRADLARRRRLRVPRARPLPRRRAAADPPHTPRPRGRVRADRRLARTRADPHVDEARVQRVPRGARVRARGPRRREPGARAHRDLAGARALPVARPRGSSRTASRSSTTGSRRGTGPRRTPGRSRASCASAG